MKRALAFAGFGVLALLLGVNACTRAEGLDETKLPSNIVPEYQLFAQRCSKCHALSRALDSGIEDDEYWARYVEKMRRQPGSGIKVKDMAPILRFLHYYSVDRRKQREAKHEEPPSTELPPLSSLPIPPAAAPSSSAAPASGAGAP